MPTQRTPPRPAQGNPPPSANVTQRLTRSSAPVASNPDINDQSDADDPPGPPQDVFQSIPLGRSQSIQSTLERNRELEDQLAQERSNLTLLRRDYADRLRALQNDFNDIIGQPAIPDPLRVAAISPPIVPPARTPAEPSVNLRSTQDVRYQQNQQQYPNAQFPYRTFLQPGPMAATPLNPIHQTPGPTPVLQPSAFGQGHEPFASRARSLRPEPFVRPYQDAYQRNPQTQDQRAFRAQEFDPNNTGQRVYRDPVVRIKPQDLGYWDPKGSPESTTDDNETSASRRKLCIPVELYVRRLYKIAERHGERQVLDNIDSALVNVSSWLMTFSHEEDMMTQSLQGWCELLIRDWGEPEVVSRQKMKDYDFSQALSAIDFWTEKMSKLQIANVCSEHDQYYEIWISLPPRWKETIPMTGSLSRLRQEIRQKEIASGWPKKSVRMATPYDSRSTLKNSRRTVPLSGNKEVERFRSDKARDPSSIPSCRICEALGKFDQKHWHRDCPNKENTKSRYEKLSTVVDNFQEDTVPTIESEDVSLTSEANDATDDSESLPSEPEKPSVVSRIYSDPIVRAVATDKFKPPTFPSPQIFEASFSSSSTFGGGDLFREGGPAHIYLRGTTKGKDVRVCADSGCGPTVGNREFIKEIYPHSVVRTRKGEPLRVKGGFGGSEYVVLTDYVAVVGYLPTTKGNLLAIQMEIHITDSCVESGLLVGSTAMKNNNLSMNFNKETLCTTSKCGQFRIKVPMYLGEGRLPDLGVIVRASETLKIPVDHEGLVRVDLNHLPKGVDLWYESRQSALRPHDKFLKGADSFVNSDVKRVLIANFGGNPEVIKKGQLIGHVRNVPNKIVVARVTSGKGPTYCGDF